MAPDRSRFSAFVQSPNGILGTLAFLNFLLHILSSAFTDYGYFIDEFYYIACSKRLAFGYVDHPPLAPFVLAANSWLLGYSLPALRFLPALAGAGTVFLAGLIAREMGGNRFSQVIASLAVFIAPAYLLLGGFYSMNPFELFLWTLCMYLLIHVLKENKPKFWVLVGIVIGVGFETKHTIILYVLAVLVGILFSPARIHVRSKWFWIGGLVACLLALPNLVWQYANGFPSLEFYRNATFYKNIPTSPWGVLTGQILLMSPVTLPLWLIGVGYLLFALPGRSYRAFGIAWIVLVLVMIAGKSSRPDRIIAIYPVLFAAGGIAIERLRQNDSVKWLPRLVIPYLITGGILMMPLAVPLLPPDALIRYMSVLGFHVEIEKGKRSPLPQWFADRFGWREMVAEVARVYQALPDDQKRNAVILANSYGQAGAIELFGQQYGLPRVISPHNTYFLWGPCSDSVKTYITVLVDREELQGNFEDIRQAGLHTCALCMNYESYMPIYVAYKPKFSIHQVWPLIKHYE